MLSLLLDNACRIQLLTKAAGGTGETFSPEDVARLHDAVTRAEQFAINFEFLRRKVNRGLLHSLV